MLAELNFTNARNNLSSVYDEVYNDLKPIIIRRNVKEQVIMLRTDLQKLLLSNFSLKPEVLPEEDGSITLALDQVDISINADSLDQAKQEMAKELSLYARDYMERSQLFLNAPNRRSHFPYVLRILLCDNVEEVGQLLEL